ncbi:PREDICTED: uncharacterized protein LOC109115387 [Nelumbo nucifera]|uniref:Uncharacterized protein LOC109115387 n=1 Tax=Nelumbo nucifera TaxID=4432 RepID=A0A1U8Q8J7_NELNU|nr:PREDICTED: uncharacterized protein LOC109115387 [Nelumbo nucifera]
MVIAKEVALQVEGFEERLTSLHSKVDGLRDEITAGLLKITSLEGGVQDLTTGFFRAELYFEINGLLPAERLRAAVVCLEGDALVWYSWEDGWQPFRSWAEFKELLLERFRSTQEGNLQEQLLSLRQSTTVKEYRRQFEVLSVPLRDLPESVLEAAFVNGLRPDIQSELRQMEPVGLMRKMVAAQKIKEKNQALWAYQSGSFPRGPTTSLSGTHFNSLVSQVLWVQDDVAEITSDASNLDCTSGDTEIALTPESATLCVSSLVGLCVANSLKVRGRILSREVVILVDSGASHNFISETLVKELKLPRTPTHEFGVQMGNGDEVRISGVCRQVCLNLPELDVIADFFPLKLGSIDVILGFSWLASLGDSMMNWGNMSMKLNLGGVRVKLQGDPSLCSSQVSLHAMMHNLQHEGQGVLLELKQLQIVDSPLNSVLPTFPPISALLDEYKDALTCLRAYPLHGLRSMLLSCRRALLLSLFVLTDILNSRKMKLIPLSLRCWLRVLFSRVQAPTRARSF